jgi:hypothetical protein
MQFVDLNPNVVEWGSEEIAIPYIKPTDKKIHRYFPDFWMKVVTKSGEIRKYIIEIKPLKETVITKKTSDRDKLVIALNYAKWEAAKSFCQKQRHGIQSSNRKRIISKQKRAD